MTSHRSVKFLAIACISAFALAGCFTGERPTLMPEETVPPVSDAAIQEVVAVLDSTPESSFTISYEVVTKFGNLFTAATLAVDPSFGTSITIAEVRYIYSIDGSTLTCSTITSECAPGIDESRVSDRQLVSTIFKKATIERMQQDARVAVGSAVASNEVIVEMNATCSAIPVVDNNGATQSKTYCAFTDLGVVASMNTADLAIKALSFTATTSADQFSA